MNTTWNLDQEYLDFTACTGLIFAQYPQLEPIRYFIFKELLIQRRSIGRTGYIKHWLRPLLRRGRTQGALNQADVIVWVDSCREVIVDTLLPVYHELASRGIRLQLTSFGGPSNLPPSTMQFQFPARA